MTNIMINVMTAWKKVHSHSGQLSFFSPKKTIVLSNSSSLRFFLFGVYDISSLTIPFMTTMKTMNRNGFP